MSCRILLGSDFRRRRLQSLLVKRQSDGDAHRRHHACRRFSLALGGSQIRREAVAQDTRRNMRSVHCHADPRVLRREILSPGGALFHRYHDGGMRPWRDGLERPNAHRARKRQLFRRSHYFRDSPLASRGPRDPLLLLQRLFL